ncbi:DNA polymerase III subunit beta [Desulfovibrio inopinatus]|uniref:DNA polymerase III subunit beta n=1 Tax=Desulfovibrio inopinatus TaxID=102109 RepID=UPI000480FC03|nr:DNA polymerase III subunit beta [Desulfovibrio inopinatus]
MFLKVIRNEIIEGLQKSSSIIPAKAGAAFLRTLWLEAEGDSLRILSTDSSIEFTGAYPAQITEPGLAGVQGRSFNDLVRKLPPGDITLKIDPETGNLLVSQGRRRYTLPTSETSWFQAFSEFPAGEAVLWSGDFLSDLIDKVGFCVSDQDTMEAMSCMFMKPSTDSTRVEVCALNGHQFGLFSFVNDDIHAILPQEGILIQRKYVTELKKWLTDDEIELSIGDKRLFVRTADNRESFSLPLSYYQFPDYRHFTAKVTEDGADSLEVDRAELIDALDRIRIFNTDSERCTFFDFESSNQIVLTSQGQEAGAANEALECVFTGNLKRVAFPTSDLIEILNHFVSQKVRFVLSGAEGPCGITGEEDPDYLIIIMPMKVVEDTYYEEEEN